MKDAADAIFGVLLRFALIGLGCYWFAVGIQSTSPWGRVAACFGIAYTTYYILEAKFDALEDEIRKIRR